MKTAAEYRAEATAVAETAPVEAPEAPAGGSTVTETPAPPPASAAPAPAAPAAVEPPAEVPASPPAPEVKPPDRVTKGFEDLAREKAALRAEKEKLKADSVILERARRMVEAGDRGDALALLAEAKIPWSKAAQQVLDGGGTPAPAAKPEPDERDRRIAALENEVSNRRISETRAGVVTQMQARTKADPAKFKLTAALGEEANAVRYIEEYFGKYNELPGETLDESIELALEATEQRLVKESKRWGPVLTSPTPVATVPAKPAVPAGAVSQQAPKTLTNNVGPSPTLASTGSKKQPKTDEEYRAAALAALTAQ